jgi:hypothetical protein
MTKEQQRFLRRGLDKTGHDFRNVLLELLDPEFDQGEQYNLDQNFEDQFQRGVVDPSMQAYRQEILPELEQRYADVGGGSSSALNQALVKSSQDLSNILAGQRIGYQGQQQQYGLQKAQLGQQATSLRQQGQQMRSAAQQVALQQIMNLVGQRAYQPIVQGPQEGLIKPLISTAGTLGAARIRASSRVVKNNIRDYDKSLEMLDRMKVKQYDYTMTVPGEQKDRVGLIAEDLPQEITAMQDGVLGVDVYGLVSILVNCVKDLNSNVKSLQDKVNQLEAA